VAFVANFDLRFAFDYGDAVFHKLGLGMGKFDERKAAVHIQQIMQAA